MPRIAAAVTVVIVMGMCIGFNAVRYPAVWTMVAAAHQPPRPEQPVLESQSPIFSEPEPVERPPAPIALIPDSGGARFSSASVDPIPFPAVLNAATDGRSHEAIGSSVNVASTTPGVSHESASSGPDTSGYGERATEPVEASPSMKYASGAAEAVAPERTALRDRLAHASRRPLVPVAPATRQQYNGTLVGAKGSRRTERLDHRVERLPAIDPIREQQMRKPAPIDGPIPIYPSTGGRNPVGQD